MSDTPKLYRQGRPVPLPFPPYPHLELRGLHDEYLILPHSIETQELHRFMMIHHDRAWKTDPIGEYRLDHLLDDLKNGHSSFGGGTGGIEAIRRFYTSWHHVGVMETDRVLVDRIKYDIRHGYLVVYRFERNPHWGMIRKTSLEPVSDPSGPVATWTGEQKVVALFRDIPECLAGAAKAEFEAFLTPTNLAVMAAFLGGIAVIQAIPGADAVVDTMIAGLAWWQFGWAGVIAAKDFVEAVIKAGRATNRQEIMLAAKLAAAALVSLGLTLLLRKIVERVHDVRWSDDRTTAGGAEPSEPNAVSSTSSKSSWTYQPRQFGQTEPGAVPETQELRARMDAAANRSAMSADGYPDLPAEVSRTFGDTPQPWNGNDEPGLISRIIGQPSSANGSFWSPGLPPSTEAEWRANAAVLNDWNGDGGYVTADPSNLTGWIGPAAPQISSDGVNVLPGQGLQIWIPPGSASPSVPMPTPWNTEP